MGKLGAAEVVRDAASVELEKARMEMSRQADESQAEIGKKKGERRRS